MKPKINGVDIKGFESVDKPFKHMSTGYTLEYEKGLIQGRKHFLTLVEAIKFCMDNQIRPEDVSIFRHSVSARRKMFTFEYAFSNYSQTGDKIKSYLSWQKVIDTDIAHITLQKEDFPEPRGVTTSFGNFNRFGENIHFIVRYKSPDKSFFAKAKEQLVRFKDWLLYNISKWN